MNNTINITIKQADITGNLDELTYYGTEGFQDAGTWQVAEETLRGGADVQLKNGPAVISYDGAEFPVKLTILEYVKEPVDDEEHAEFEPVCEFEIKPEDGRIERLAALLGLLEHYSPKQLRAVIGSSHES